MPLTNSPNLQTLMRVAVYAQQCGSRTFMSMTTLAVLQGVSKLHPVNQWPSAKKNSVKSVCDHSVITG